MQEGNHIGRALTAFGTMVKLCNMFGQDSFMKLVNPLSMVKLVSAATSKPCSRVGFIPEFIS